MALIFKTNKQSVGAPQHIQPVNIWTQILNSIYCNPAPTPTTPSSKYWPYVLRSKSALCVKRASTFNDQNGWM